jgi:hypothetical protein
MAWQPEDGQLRQLAGYLKDSLSGHNPVAQKNASSVSWNPLLLSNWAFAGVVTSGRC